MDSEEETTKKKKMLSIRCTRPFLPVSSPTFPPTVYNEVYVRSVHCSIDVFRAGVADNQTGSIACQLASSVLFICTVCVRSYVSVCECICSLL